MLNIGNYLDLLCIAVQVVYFALNHVLALSDTKLHQMISVLRQS